MEDKLIPEQDDAAVQDSELQNEQSVNDVIEPNDAEESSSAPLPPGPPPPPPAMYLRQHELRSSVSDNNNNNKDCNNNNNSNSKDEAEEVEEASLSHADALALALAQQQTQLRHVTVVEKKIPLLTSESELKSKLKNKNANTLAAHKAAINALASKIEHSSAFYSVDKLKSLVNEINAMRAKIQSVDSQALSAQTSWPEEKVSTLISVMHDITQAQGIIARGTELGKKVGAALQKDTNAMVTVVFDLQQLQAQLPHLCHTTQEQGIDIRPCVGDVVSAGEGVMLMLLEKLFAIAFDKHSKVLQARTKFDLQFLVKNTESLLSTLITVAVKVNTQRRPTHLIHQAREKLQHLHATYADILGRESPLPLQETSLVPPLSSSSSALPSSSSSSLSRSGSHIRPLSTSQLNVDSRLHSLLFSYSTSPQQSMQKLLQLLQPNNNSNNSNNTTNNNNESNTSNDSNNNSNNSSDGKDESEDASVDVDGVDGRNRTAMEIAVCKGLLDVMKVLIEHGANAKRIDSKGNSYLHIALLTPSLPSLAKLQCLQLLVSHNVDINISNATKETPLHIACRQCEVDIVKFLIASGANLFVTDAYNKQPLQHLAMKWHGTAALPAPTPSASASSSSLSSSSTSSSSSSSSSPSLNFSSYYNSPTHSDITLVVGDQRFFAHKLVLCVQSDVFKRMLEGEWKEGSNHSNNSNNVNNTNSNSSSSSNSSDTNRGVLTLADIDPNTFRYFLQFFYYGLDHVRIPKEDVSLGLDLLTLADRFLLPSLCAKLESLLHARMTVENLFVIYTHARTYRNTSLQTAAANMILQNYESIEFADEGRQILTFILADHA